MQKMMKVCLKELCETRVWLLMMVKVNLIRPASKLKPLILENNELISLCSGLEGR